METSLFEKACIYALQAHEGMKRKVDQIPYILHPMEVASIVATMTDSQEVLAAAMLHDVVEDTPHTIEDIQENFGDRITELVKSETENKNATWMIRKKDSLDFLKSTDDLDVKIIWMGDKLANMRSFYRIYQREGNSMWNRFNQTDIKMQKWYYESILNALEDLKDTYAWKEYRELYNIVFKGV